MKKRIAPTLRHPSEADAVVLTPPRHDAKASGTYQRKDGEVLTRKTLWLPEVLAEELGVYAVRQKQTEAGVVALALRRLLGRE